VKISVCWTDSHGKDRELRTEDRALAQEVAEELHTAGRDPLVIEEIEPRDN
jgi:hypothetical protein